MEFSAAQRKRTMESVPGKVYDLLVVGGGITGACIARDAARRGLSVLLVDKNDWAFGTSSRSSKLVHGGLRYLELFDFKLVFEACRERRRLLLNAPHLVWPQPFTFPVYKGDKNGMFMIGSGLWLYDFLALFRNVHNHRLHGPKALLEVEPGLDAGRLKGGGVFYDCATDDARLTLAHVQSACLEGADCLSYCRSVEFLRRGEMLRGALLRDEFTRNEFEAEARVVVNATGPWTDVTCCIDDSCASSKLRPTKGAHIIVPRSRLNTRNALPIMSPRDQRLLFVVPWGDFSLIGTTDTDYEGDYDNVHADRDDVEYIVEAANLALPGAKLEMRDIVSTYAGLRPLICEQGSTGVKESQVSREHSIYESPSGLITITGGKLTTARSMAEELVDLAARRLAERFDVKPVPKCATRYAGVQGKDGPGFPGRLEGLAREYRMGDDVIGNLQMLGTGAVEVLGRVRRDLDLGEKLDENVPYIRAQVEYAVDAEMALTINDFMVRRSRIYYEAPDQGLEVLEKVANIMAARLGWGVIEMEEQMKEYRRTVEMSRQYKA